MLFMEVFFKQNTFFLNLTLMCMQGFLSAFDSDASLDVLDHPILDLIYYMVCCLIVLFCYCYLKFDLSLSWHLEFTFHFSKCSWLRSYLQLWSYTSCANCPQREYQPNIILSVNCCS